MTYVSGLFTGFVNMMFTLLNSFVTWLSFSSEIENMVDAVNHKIDEPPTRIGHRMSSHPGGFAKIVGKRRLNMAGAYIKISNDHAPQDAAERLTALKMLAVPDDDIDLILQGVRDWDYKPVMEADAKR